MKGQIHLEAMISLVFLIAFVGLLVGFASETRDLEGEQIFSAETKAQACALAVNSLFSNTGSSLKEFNTACYSGSEFEILSGSGENSKASACIAMRVKTTHVFGKNVLEVKTSGHYAK